MICWKGAICLATLASFMQAALALATSSLPLWKASPFTFLLTSRAATMSWYFQPTSCPSLPREQKEGEGRSFPQGQAGGGQGQGCLHEGRQGRQADCSLPESYRVLWTPVTLLLLLHLCP